MSVMRFVCSSFDFLHIHVMQLVREGAWEGLTHSASSQGPVDERCTDWTAEETHIHHDGKARPPCGLLYQRTVSVVPARTES